MQGQNINHRHSRGSRIYTYIRQTSNELDLCSWHPQNPEDEIVIFPKKNTYFSRKGSFDDKGELTKFVLKRLHMFSYCTQQGYRGVNEVLSRYMTGERIVTGNVQSRTKDHTQNYIKEFNLNYWNPRPIKRIIHI